MLRSHHREQEDLLSDYDNLLNAQDMADGSENSIVIFRNGIAPYSERTAGKLAVRDSVRTVQNNIYLAYQLLYQVQFAYARE